MKKMRKKEEKKRLKEEGKSIEKVTVQPNLAEKKALEYLTLVRPNFVILMHVYVSQAYQRFVKQWLNGCTSCTSVLV